MELIKISEALCIHREKKNKKHININDDSCSILKIVLQVGFEKSKTSKY